MPMQTSSDAPNHAALTAFRAAKAEIDVRLARLAALSAEHFGVPPDTIHWGHVSDLQRYAGLLREITDVVFHEGEHAG